jgi:hypothetical protein
MNAPDALKELEIGSFSVKIMAAIGRDNAVFECSTGRM